MKHENKDLLLKYLCMALPYGVKVYCGEDLAMTLKQIDYQCFCECWENEDLKCNSRWMLPYLRPMSSMNEEEIIEFNNIPSTKNYQIVNGDLPWDVANYKQINWLLENHFDFIVLIPKGLAIEAPKEMYKKGE